MFSVLDIQTVEDHILSKKLVSSSTGGTIIIEIPKFGQLYFSDREIIHEDYILGAYSYHLLGKFEIIEKEIPVIDEFISFTFRLRISNDANFFRELAKILITISAGYGNEEIDPEDRMSYADEAFQFCSDWAVGRVKTEPTILNEYTRLKTEWPLGN